MGSDRRRRENIVFEKNVLFDTLHLTRGIWREKKYWKSECDENQHDSPESRILKTRQYRDYVILLVKIKMFY